MRGLNKIGILLTILGSLALTGCGDDNRYNGHPTNKHDADIVDTVVDGAIKLQKMEDKKAENAARDRSIQKSAEANAAVKIVESTNETMLKAQRMELEAATKVETSEAQRDILVNRDNKQTEVELKRLETEARTVVDQNALEQKKTLDVNQQAEREFELEKMRIQLLEAEKLKNQLEIEKTRMENERLLREAEEAKRIEAEKVKAKAKADAERAKANAAAAKVKAQRDKEKQELELLKALQ